MKIGIPVLARDSYLDLITVVNTTYRFRSGGNQIKFYIRYDNDDTITASAVEQLRCHDVPMEVLIGPRPETLGATINEMVKVALADGCDVITVLSDDLIPAHACWDQIIGTWVIDRKLDFFAWKDMQNLGLVTCPVVTAKWVYSVGHYMPEWFPFWFSDTWMHEVYVIASGKPALIIDELMLMPTNDTRLTRGMRDLEFWVRFWNATQSIRIEDGLRARRNMDWPEIDLAPLLPQLHGSHSWNVANSEELRGEAGPAPERYQRAKKRAENWMRNNGKGGIGGE